MNTKACFGKRINGMRFSLFFCVMSLVAITLSGCLSLMNLSPEDRFIFSTPHPAEAEVYMRVIRDYSVGDWLHGIESDFHVNRIFWNARYGYLRVPKEDMRYAQRLIDAEILYKTSYLLWDCWPRNKEREKKLGSTFTSRFVGASPYPECLAFWGYPMSGNRKSIQEYFDEAARDNPSLKEFFKTAPPRKVH